MSKHRTLWKKALVLTVASAVLNTAPAGAAGEAAYPRVGIKQLTPGNVQDWSPDGNYVTMSKQTARADGSYAPFETFLLRAADGSVVKNLNTAPGKNNPPALCDRGNARFHPSGRYLVVMVGNPEMGCPNYHADPGKGAWTNLWIHDLVTSEWTNLTNYNFLPSWRAYGTLFPNFSRDGKTLTWAKLLAPADFTNVLGKWELHVATFSDVGGPHLENDRAYRPGSATFYEPYGFTADDKQILMAANVGMTSAAATLGGTDLYLFNPTNGALTNWTDTPNEYDEHARISPDGKTMAWGASGEVWVRPLDKSTPRMRLTFFNTWGYPEYNWLNWGWAMTWSPDGKKLIVVEQFFGNEIKNRSWVVTLKA